MRHCSTLYVGHLNDFMRWVSSDQARTRYKFLLEQYEVSTTNIPKSTQQMIYYPTNKIRVPVNKENVLKSGVVKPEDADLMSTISTLISQSQDSIKID